jgi:hypothetical protein
LGATVGVVRAGVGPGVGADADGGGDTADGETAVVVVAGLEVVGEPEWAAPAEQPASRNTAQTQIAMRR